MNVTQHSKFLSLVLRHKPEAAGVKLDKAGWVSVADLLAGCTKHGRAMTIDMLNQVVAENNKKRFEFSEDRTMIRASQGHSIGVELGYTEANPPIVLYHGTDIETVGFIRAQGIKKMNRDQVHLSADAAVARQVGSRHGVPIVLTIDTRQMAADGAKFYCSTNGVWLTDYVSPKYII
jgi:putative RNA 2'-phosphotransferase